MSARLNPARGLRVLMSTDAVGGVWHYSMELARELAREDIETVLAILGPSPSDSQRRETCGIPSLSLIETGLPLDWTAAAAGEVWSASEALAALARRRGVDLVHLHAPALVADTRYPVPIVVTVHSCLATWWSAVRSGPMPPDFQWRAQLTASGLRQADAIIAPSASFAEALCAAYGETIRPVVIHNGRRPSPPIQCDKLRMVLTVGRLWDEGKNIAALDRASGRLNAPIYAAGGTIGPNGEIAHCSHLRTLGVLSTAALRRWYAAAPIFASTAIYEPFGLAALEAAQSGAALVLADIPTFRELWDGAAVFVDPKNTIALADILQQALDSPASLEQLSARSRERASRYGAARMARETRSVYRALVASENRVTAM